MTDQKDQEDEMASQVTSVKPQAPGTAWSSSGRTLVESTHARNETSSHKRQKNNQMHIHDFFLLLSFVFGRSHQLSLHFTLFLASQIAFFASTASIPFRSENLHFLRFFGILMQGGNLQPSTVWDQTANPKMQK